jgi:hypothetical protein
MEINLDPVQLGKFYPKNRQIFVLVCIAVYQHRFMLIRIRLSILMPIRIRILPQDFYSQRYSLQCFIFPIIFLCQRCHNFHYSRQHIDIFWEKV